MLIVSQWLFYSICLVVYNVFFHPLSSFPGPKLAAASHLVHIYYTTTGTIVPWHEQMHREFGDVVRISPNELSFITEGTWKDVYTHRQGRPLMQKHVVFTRMAKADSLLIANDAAHTRGRKVLAHAFSDRALREQEPIIKSYVDLLISKLHGETRADSTVVNLMAWYNFTTFDIISDLCFAVSFGNLDNKDGHPFIRSMFLGFKWGALMGQASLYPPLNSIIKVLLPPSIKRKKQESFAGTQAKVRNRILQGSDRPDIMSRVLLYNDEKGLTRDEIDSNFLLLLAAGSETTATLLSGATYHLLKNPTALQQLNDEVRQAFHLETAITVAATEKLPVLNAVIQESLRMYPPVPVSLRRVVPPGGDTIDGRWVPGGVCSPSSLNLSQPRPYHSTRKSSELTLHLDCRRRPPESSLQLPP